MRIAMVTAAVVAGAGFGAQEKSGGHSSQTHALVINAPRDKVFAFLSKVENLPKWAVVFCQGVEKRDGRWWVKTPQGEVIFRMEADARTGVIDMYVGPGDDRMELTPSRVVALPGNRTLYLFTAIQYPPMSDADFKQLCVPLVEKEFPALRRQVE